MNKYSTLLSDLIDKSGLSLTDLAQKAEKHGQKVTTSYLSKLKNGKMPPPSFKISIALALSLEIEPEKLLAAGILDNNENNKEELQKSLEELYPDMDYGDVIEKVWRITLVPDQIVNPPRPEDYILLDEYRDLYKDEIFTLNEVGLLKEPDLSLEALKGNYNLEIDGKKATDEEIEKMVEYIKIYRLMKQNEAPKN